MLDRELLSNTPAKIPSTAPVAVAFVIPSIHSSRTCGWVQSNVVILQYSSPSLHSEMTFPCFQSQDIHRQLPIAHPRGY
jgi:hypothetical protein